MNSGSADYVTYLKNCHTTGLEEVQRTTGAIAQVNFQKYQIAPINLMDTCANNGHSWLVTTP